MRHISLNKKLVLIVAAAAMFSISAGLFVPAAHAQFSDSYNFLKAVKERKGDEAEKFLSEPGTVIVNTRDSTTGETALHIVIQRRDSTWLSPVDVGNAAWLCRGHRDIIGKKGAGRSNQPIR
jgi:uncharacterized protein